MHIACSAVAHAHAEKTPVPQEHYVYLCVRVKTVRACLHEGGGPRVGEVTCGKLPHLSCKRDHNKMRDYMDRRVTPPKRVTSPTCGPPPPCKQALSILKAMDHYSFDGVGRGGGAGMENCLQRLKH